MMTSKPFIFNLKHFKLAIIDESSQILEPNLIGLLSAIDKFILIGDYKQLPAVVQQSEQDSAIPTINDSQQNSLMDMSILQGICLTNCRNSLSSASSAGKTMSIVPISSAFCAVKDECIQK